jgi:hypothetical protein
MFVFVFSASFVLVECTSLLEEHDTSVLRDHVQKRVQTYLKKLKRWLLESISWVLSNAASMWSSHLASASLVTAYGLCLPIKAECLAKKQSKHDLIQ